MSQKFASVCICNLQPEILDKSTDWSTYIVRRATQHLPLLPVGKMRKPKNRILSQTRSKMAAVSWFSHREHTILLNRERVNKGTKRMNSLPLSPLVISFILRDIYWEHCCLQILRDTEALNSYQGLSALSKNIFGFV